MRNRGVKVAIVLLIVLTQYFLSSCIGNQQRSNKYNTIEHYSTSIKPGLFGYKKYLQDVEVYDSKNLLVQRIEYGQLFHIGQVDALKNGNVKVISGHGRNFEKISLIEDYYYKDSQGEPSVIISNHFSDNSIRFIDTVLFEYDINGNLIQMGQLDGKDTLINKPFSSYFTGDTSWVYYDEYEPKSRVKFDEQGRETDKIRFLDGTFLRRTVTVYGKDMKTVFLYNDSPDNLWSYTEYKYSYLNGLLVRKYWKVLNSSTEKKEIFFYDKQERLTKVERYRVNSENGLDELFSRDIYKYKK